jgi:WD40 repeat protein
MKMVPGVLVVCLILLCGASASWAAGQAAKRKRASSFSADGAKIAVASGKTKLAVLDAEGTTLREETFDAPAAETAFSPDGKRLAVCLEKGGIVVTEEGKSSRKIPEPAGECSELTWSPDGKKLYYSLTRTGTDSPNAPNDTHEFKIWDAATERLNTASSAIIERPDSGFKGNVAPTPQTNAPLRRPKTPPHPDALGRIPQIQ